MDQNKQAPENQQSEIQEPKQPSSFSSKHFVFILIIIVVGLGIAMMWSKKSKQNISQSTTSQLQPQLTPTITIFTFNYKKRHYDQSQMLYPEGKIDYPIEVKNISDEKLTAFDCYETTYTIEKLQKDDDYLTGEGTHLDAPIKKIIRNSVSSLGWSNSKPMRLEIPATFCESVDNNFVYWFTKQWEQEDSPSNNYVPTQVYFFTHKTTEKDSTLIATIPVDSAYHWRLKPLQLTTDNHFYFLNDYRDEIPYPQGSENFLIYDVNLNLKNSYVIIMQKDCTMGESPIKCTDK